MIVTYRCPHCEQTSRSEPRTDRLACRHCGGEVRFPAEALDGREVRRCMVCPSTELFVRKDFPQRLGIAIIGAGFVASSIALAWHQSVASLAILISTAFLDAVLYLVMGNVLTCYRCHAEYRGVAGLEQHPAFELAVHERHRQQAARLAAAEEAASRIAPAKSSPS